MRLAGLFALLLVLAAGAAGADEGSFEDKPAGSSVEDLTGALERAVEEPERKATLFPYLTRALQHLPPFFADSEVFLGARAYFLPLRKPDGRTAYALTAGGKLGFRSGWLRDFAQVGFGLYGSYPLAQDDPQALTQLLREGGSGYTIPGEAFLRLRWKGTEATFYRHELDLPWVNRSDSRMTPNSFQGALLRGKHPSDRLGDVDWVGGWITDIRFRTEDDFISMGQRAVDNAKGILGSDNNAGMLVAGVQIEPFPETRLGVYNYFVPKVLNITYLATDVTKQIRPGWGFRTQWQFTYQGDGGGKELLGRRFKTWTFGGRAALSNRGITGWIGFSLTGDQEDIRSPYGTYPGYISMMQSDFNSAGETAFLIGASYDLKAEGISTFAQLGMGRGANDPVLGLNDLNEVSLDWTLDYTLPRGKMKGLWFRLRTSLLHVDAPGRDIGAEIRLIVNYDLPVL